MDNESDNWYQEGYIAGIKEGELRMKMGMEGEIEKWKEKQENWQESWVHGEILNMTNML